MKDEFLDYLQNIKKYSYNTIINYEIDIDRYINYLKLNKIDIFKIEYKDVLDYISYLKKNHKSTSINRSISSIRTYYNYLIKNNYTNSNPFKIINGMKKEKKLPEYFKYNEYVELVNSIDINSNLGIRNKCIFEVLLCTGCRCNELVNIKLDDINLNEKEIKVLGKGNKERIVYLGSYAIESI